VLFDLYAAINGRSSTLLTLAWTKDGEWLGGTQASAFWTLWHG